MSGYPKRVSNSSRSNKVVAVLFDLPTVSKMLPLVRQIVTDLLASERQIGTFLWEQEGLERNKMELSWPERKRRYFLQEELADLQRRRKGLKAELETLGVKVIDSVQGRIGFPTIVNNREAYFSWQPGEETVCFWHFSGDQAKRRSIPGSWFEDPIAASAPTE